MLDYTNASIIYVSQSEGNDRNNGFERVSGKLGQGPVKSIDRAIRMLYEMRACGAFQPMTVKFIGDYYLSSPFSPG